MNTVKTRISINGYIIEMESDAAGVVAFLNALRDNNAEHGVAVASEHHTHNYALSNPSDDGTITGTCACGDTKNYSDNATNDAHRAVAAAPGTKGKRPRCATCNRNHKPGRCRTS